MRLFSAIVKRWYGDEITIGNKKKRWKIIVRSIMELKGFSHILIFYFIFLIVKTDYFHIY